MKNSMMSADDLQNMLDNQPQGQEKAFDLYYYLELLLQRRWLVIVPVIIAAVVGIYQAITLPKTYQAETLIMIEPQKVPDNYVQAIVSSDLEARISTIKEMILSRTNLLKIIENFNLFSDPEYINTFQDDKIETMRRRTSVDIVASRSRTASAFKIAYVGKDPQNIVRVVNAMAALVIDQNLKVRESQAVGTVEFLDNELVKMRRRLEEVETLLKDYRKNHMGELPDQLTGNLMVLERLQQQLNDKRRDLREEKNKLISLDNQIQLAREQIATTVTTTTLPERGEPTTLEGLKQQLAEYKIRYTPQHPDVIMLQKKIEDLERELSPPSSNTADSGSTQMVRPATRNGVEADLSVQRNSTAREIAAIKEEISDLEKQIDIYQRRIENTPKLEQELISLKRDYDNTQKTYESLLDRKQEAEVAANMERQQKGEQFRILDPARLPDRPKSPDMRKLFLMCVMAGLGLGCGLIFALDYIDSSVKKPEIVPTKLGIPLLVTMPTLKRPKDIRNRRINDGLSILAATVCLALLALFAAVSVLGMPGPTEMVKRLLT